MAGLGRKPLVRIALFGLLVLCFASNTPLLPATWVRIAGRVTAITNGQGVPVGLITWAKPDGTQSWQIFPQGCVPPDWLPPPLDFGPATEQAFLQLYGTGVRGRTSLAGVSVKIGGIDAPVEYAGALTGHTGRDQVKVQLPRNLAGRGEVDLVLTVDGEVASTVRVNIG